MVFYTIDEIRDVGRGRSWTAPGGAGEVLRKSASRSGPFDIFLSHSFKDAEVILGVAATLEKQGYRVYVDWIQDRLLDRSRVTTETASVLRSRMQQCKSMIFATSDNSTTSKWMPWELGFFDGRHGRESVAIMPLVAFGGGDFKGQEYLGIYPLVEKLGTWSSGSYETKARVATSDRNGRKISKSLGDLVRAQAAYS